MLIKASNNTENQLTDRPLNRSLRRDLRASCGDAVAFGGMVGLGETFLPAFVLAVGLGELTAGLVASLPQVCGGLMQTVSPTAVRLLGSHKRWVVMCATIQALTFIPLIVAAAIGSISGPLVFLIATIYWSAGLATGPAWNTWIGTLVPRAIRARYFSMRTRGQQVAVLLAFLTGGIGLQVAGDHGRLMTAFALMFAAAGVCRLISTFLLSRQSEPCPVPKNMRHIPLAEVVQLLRLHGGGRLLVYLAAVQATVQIASPYFTPFMLEKLQFSYAQFVTLISISFLSKAIALPNLGRLAHSIGAHRLLWFGGIAIVPISGCWLLSQQMAWLALVQVMSGVAWAGYELAFFLLFFESIPQQQRTSLLTVYNVINTSASLVGALTGGALLYCFGASYNGYLFIFAFSALARCLPLLLLARLPVLNVPADPIGVRSVGVRPNAAGMDVPMLPSLPDQAAASKPVASR